MQEQKPQKDALLFFRRFVVDIVASLPLTYLTLIYNLAAEGSNQPAGNLSFAKTLRMVQNAFLEPFIYYTTNILPRQARDKHRKS